jgi:hypothetical protein
MPSREAVESHHQTLSFQLRDGGLFTAAIYSVGHVFAILELERKFSCHTPVAEVSNAG